MTDRTVSLVLLLGLSSVLLIAPFLTSIGFFTIDEAIYFLSVDQFRSGQGFFIDNGSSAFRSEDLGMGRLLVLTENGYAPQYPPGTAIVGSVFVDVFGARGLFMINALAAIGSLFASYLLARRLFGSVAVANLSVTLLALCSFLGEYAVGYWPHMVSVLSVTLSLYFFLLALEDSKTLLWAAASGLVLGVGLFFRVDGVLLLVPIAVLTALYAKRPVAVFFGGALGLLPPLAGLSFVNSIKFGTLNPISYGKSGGGGTDPTTYIGFALVAALVPILIWTIRMRGGLPKFWSPAFVGVALAACLVSPQLTGLLQVFSKGVLSLFVDATYIQDARTGVLPGPGGTLSFWGLPKKALGQSLPWLGLLLALALLPTARHKRSISIVLIFVVLWSVPFVLRNWHGGIGSNMRYFMPFLPALSALVAWIILEVLSPLQNPHRPVLIGAVIGAVCVGVWALLAASGSAGVHQVLSTYVLIAVAVLVVFGLTHERLRAIAGVAVGLGLCIGLTNSWADQIQAQHRRSAANYLAVQLNQLQKPVVVYGAPEVAIYAEGESQVFSALPSQSGELDRAFVEQALAANHRVIVPLAWTNFLGDDFKTLTPTPSDLPDMFFEIVVAQ